MATHDRKACSAHLTLVAPPISNTMATSINNDDTSIVSILRRSHFYMICGRSKANFDHITLSGNGGIDILIKMDSGLSSKGTIHIQHMLFFRKAENETTFTLNIKHTKNVIRIFNGTELVFATSPDELLMNRGRKKNFVTGFDNYREIMTFDLLYVGIAKGNQDSYNRLIARGHLARTNILAAEEQRSPGARVSDETYLLFFEIEPLTLTVFSGDGDFDDEDLNFTIDYHRVVADAEKAIISTFKPKYNKQQYVNYPKGTDGLYGQGYGGYSYSISEGIAFNTNFGTIKGARDSDDFLLSNDADFISINGDEVTLNISGVDFNIPLDHNESHYLDKS